MRHQSSGRRPIRQEIEGVLGDEQITAICYRERTGTLDEPTFTWHEYESVVALPECRLDGWEELLVFTEEDVYQWSETGYSNGPRVVPRTPSVVCRESALIE